MTTTMGNERPTRRDAWLIQQAAREAFVRVVRELAAARIQVLAVKGIVLGRDLYPEGDRFMVDVDIRVLPRDLDRVSAIARGRGWRVQRTSKQLGTLEINLGANWPLVEVETTVGPPGVCAIDVATMLGRAVQCRAEGGAVWMEPELHDHTLLLCINVFKDKLVLARPWAREDLLRISVAQGFSAHVLAGRAAEARLREMVGIVATWLGPSAPTWRPVADALAAQPRRRLYARAYGAVGRRWPRGRLMAVLARAASDDPRMRLKAVAAAVGGTLRHAVFERLERPRQRS